MKYLKVDFRFHKLLAFLPKNTSLPPIIYQKDFVQRAEATGDVLCWNSFETTSQRARHGVTLSI